MTPAESPTFPSVTTPARSARVTLIAAPAGPDRVALTYRIGQHDNQPAVHDRYMAAAAVLGVAVV